MTNQKMLKALGTLDAWWVETKDLYQHILESALQPILGVEQNVLLEKLSSYLRNPQGVDQIPQTLDMKGAHGGTSLPESLMQQLQNCIHHIFLSPSL